MNSPYNIDLPPYGPERLYADALLALTRIKDELEAIDSVSPATKPARQPN